ncbi:hypothetical protein AVEN_59629-1 [Araneus ventricosus]|uniref:Uncharacterized protein n=1 Tax=Araneus ventricosus TaxID=182803 RepID=A0A4Y2LYU5_ARAVE|nr:hypothetical protein AVEN_59629-1 [Araneus ventricosus]
MLQCRFSQKIADTYYLKVNQSDSEVTTQSSLYKERSASDDVVIKKVNVKMGESKDLSDFEQRMIVCARIAGTSIPETMTLLGISLPTVSRGVLRVAVEKKHFKR